MKSVAEPVLSLAERQAVTFPQLVDTLTRERALRTTREAIDLASVLRPDLAAGYAQTVE